MQKVVVVGCGWLGQQLATALASAGFDVFGSRQSAAGLAELPAGIQPLLLQLPLTLPDASVTEIFKDSWLICLIPPAGRQQSTAQYLTQLQNLLDIAISAGVRGLIHCSSTGVYQGLSGDVDELSVEQSSVPENSRAWSLLAAEQILQQFPNCITLRLAGLIGPGRNPAWFGQGRTLTGAALPVNLVHALDISRFVLTLLTAPLPVSPRLYNLCCPDHPQKIDFYHAAALQAGLPAVTFVASDEPARRVLSVRSEQLAGFCYQFKSPFQALTSC